MIYDAVLTKYIYLMGIGKKVTGSFHDQYEITCGLKHMILDDVLT
jgi:hypothetical protein